MIFLQKNNFASPAILIFKKESSLVILGDKSKYPQ